MKQIICDSFASGWIELLDHLIGNGPFVQPRGLKNWEETCVSLRVNHSERNILVHPVRRLNYRFMVAEWIWYMRGRNDLAALTRFNPNMAKFSDDGRTLAGAYGPRLESQWPYIYSMLLRDPDTRQAIASIWTPNPEPSLDIPCTLSLQFLRREDKLNLIVTMRSSDIWLGLPYDMFSFSQMQNAIAGELQLARGWIQFNLGSSHLYEEHEMIARETVLADSGSYYSMDSPALHDWIPPMKQTPLSMPWLIYDTIINKARSSAEALEFLHDASKLG